MNDGLLFIIGTLVSIIFASGYFCVLVVAYRPRQEEQNENGSTSQRIPEIVRLADRTDQDVLQTL